MKKFSPKKLAPWWTVTLKGAFLFAIGLMIFFNPDPYSTEFRILPYLGIIWVASGIGFVVVALIARSTNKTWKWHIAEGGVDLATGAIIIADTVNAGQFAPYAIGAWAILAGIVAVAQAFVIKAHGYNLWAIALSWGVVSMILGVLMLMSKPIFTDLGLIYILAAVMMIFGSYQFTISFKLKSLISPASSETP